MKNTLFTMILICIAKMQVDGQSTGTGNAPTSGNYLGWDNTSTQALDIVSEATQPIYFYTSGGASGGSGIWNNMRMSIFEGTMVAPDGSNHNVGRVGITVYIHQ